MAATARTGEPISAGSTLSRTQARKERLHIGRSRPPRHLVVVFPLWQGTIPTLLKAFIEQLMRPGAALEYREHGPEGATRRTLGAARRHDVTMGMPALMYRWYFRAHGVRGLERNVLKFAGMKPVRETLLGTVDAASDAKRRRWLERMRDYGRRLS